MPALRLQLALFWPPSILGNLSQVPTQSQIESHIRQGTSRNWQRGLSDSSQSSCFLFGSKARRGIMTDPADGSISGNKKIRKPSPFVLGRRFEDRVMDWLRKQGFYT